MADKIVGILKPFDIEQFLYVFKDDEKVDEIQTTTNDIANTVIGLSKKYNIYELDLTGPKQYAEGISKTIYQEEINLYNKNNMTINII